MSGGGRIKPTLEGEREIWCDGSFHLDFSCLTNILDGRLLPPQITNSQGAKNHTDDIKSSSFITSCRGALIFLGVESDLSVVNFRVLGSNKDTNSDLG